MNIDEFYGNEAKLNSFLKYFGNKKLLRKEEYSKDLVNAHIDKAKHNLKFFDKNKDDFVYCDWMIVTLYYALYHCALALVANKGYISKNHTATLLFLMKYYGFQKDEINLIDELFVSKNDAEFYTILQNDRHDANYSTSIKFSKEQIDDYRTKVLNFLFKVQGIVLL